jgi:hypothetical protein
MTSPTAGKGLVVHQRGGEKKKKKKKEKRGPWKADHARQL